MKPTFSALCALAAFAAAADPANPFGATAHVSRDEFDRRDKAFELCHAMGMGQIRFDYQMRDMKPTKDGPWNFDRYDKIVESAARENVTMLPILFALPGWALPVWEHADVYAEFARVTVQRYGRKMPVLEIWNEQNIPGFWKPEPCASNYLTILRAAYRAAKEVDPGIRIAFGGTAGTDLDYIGEIYALGGKDDFDIMNVHPYSHPHPPEGRLDVSLESLRKLMANYGDAGKPVWITEHGWPTHRQGIGSSSGNFILPRSRRRAPRRRSGTWSAPSASRTTSSLIPLSRTVSARCCPPARRWRSARRSGRTSGWRPVTWTRSSIRRTSRIPSPRSRPWPSS